MAIEFEYFIREKHDYKFNKFVNETYGLDSFLKLENYADWWFKSHKKSSGIKTRLLLALQDNDIVGMNAIISTPMCGHNHLDRIGWLANTMVRSDFRGRGLGTILVKKTTEDFQLSGSISFKEEAQKILEHLNYKIEKNPMKRFVMIIDDILSKSLVIKSKKRLFDLLFMEQVNKKRENTGLQTVSSVNLEKIWAKCKHRYGLATDRNSNFLNWRYSNHPYGKYYFLSIISKNPEAALILRVERVEGLGVKIARIVDIFGMAHEIPFLILELKPWLRHKKIAFADFFCNRSPDELIFSQSDLVCLPSNEENILPFLFQPLNADAHYSEKIAIKIPHNISIKRMYITRGDSDRDRPV